MACMDAQTKAMQAMHGMMVAEHMNAMFGGGMGGMKADQAMRQPMMEKRMDKLQSMMQMRIDRMPDAPAK